MSKSNGELLSSSSQFLQCYITSSLENQTIAFIWMKNGLPVMTNSRITVSDSQNVSTLQFSPLRTSDGGQYQCVATILSGEMVFNVTNEIDLNVTGKMNNLNVCIDIMCTIDSCIVSISSVAVTIVPNDTLYEATPVDIICNVTVDDNVDTPYSITQQWLAPNLLTSGSDYSISNNVLRINRLSVSRDDNRTITCVTRVNPSPESLYVLQNIASKSNILIVTGEETIIQQ